ncbi:unnamed protein product [Lupinus luteus]|uniref:Uncharacterized protein n=1 Tax=Lupinus luteus TaxID=3873 RepID=A0AAV1YFJ1_LUPLU
MGEGKENKTRPQPHLQIQERGEIYFFYRPKVGKEEAHSDDDVQRLYIIMRPESGERAIEEKQHHGHDDDDDANKGCGGHGSQKVNIEEESLFRLIVMGRKRLPDPAQKSTPYWGFVEMVTTKEYETSTRGQRHTSDARAVGEGIYRIVRHEREGKTKQHTHLIYKLEFPSGESEKREPQESLNIKPEGSFIIQIKNPEKGSEGLQKKRKAVFPAHLQGKLGHLKFAPPDPPDFLNYEGCELLFISASDHIEHDLGLELLTDPSCSHLLNTFGDSLGSTTPLLKGTWA